MEYQTNRTNADRNTARRSRRFSTKSFLYRSGQVDSARMQGMATEQSTGTDDQTDQHAMLENGQSHILRTGGGKTAGAR